MPFADVRDTRTYYELQGSGPLLLFVSGSAGEAVPFTQVLVVSIAAISLLTPVHGVHLRLAEQKRERLARLGEAEQALLAAFDLVWKLGEKEGEVVTEPAEKGPDKEPDKD